MTRWLRMHPYLVPLAFAIVLGIVGRSAYHAVEVTSRQQLATRLATILDANLAALDVWLASQRAVGQDLAADRELIAATERLVARYREAGPAGLESDPSRAEIDAIVNGVVARHDYLGWRLFDTERVCLASSDRRVLGRVGLDERNENARIQRGETLITPPLSIASEELVSARLGVMAILTPVYAADGRLLGSLALGIDAATTFSRLLEAARMGETGDTYAFSRGGRLLSESRFEPELRRIGLLPGDPAVGSFMHIEIRDPGGDLTAGFVPTLPLLARPLTVMAASAVVGGSGMDLDGYRDYRGVMVVGAWQFLPELELGIATEIGRNEAYAALSALRTRIGGLILLLALAALGMLLYSIAIRRVQGDLAAARRLGRYRIERIIGRGGMGTVYLARHALLRRPTAVKVLRPQHTTKETIARFEREVQVTSQLTHPNTIEIYDYGETRDGLFYYAMEYLEGATLREVVDASGAMSEARALPILRQMCGSIAESHRVGMIHRDIKPSNVMLCERGGLLDFVKVVDFGLVKPLLAKPDEALTDVRSLTGTPLYMPPELIDSGDAAVPASDVYQIGAVGYFLLAGRHVFEGDSVIAILDQHLNTPPRRLAEVTERPVDARLEAVLMGCLAKDPGQRPVDAGELLAALERIEVAGAWTRADAQRFWAEWRPAAERAPEAGEGWAPVGPGDSFDMGDRLGDVRSR